MFFAREVRGAARRKQGAAGERGREAAAGAPGRPAAPAMGGGEEWHSAGTVTDVEPFAVDNPLTSQRGRDGEAAPALVVAQAGHRRHESVEADEAQVRKRERSVAEEELRDRARTIFNATRGANTVPTGPQRSSAGGAGASEPAREAAV